MSHVNFQKLPKSEVQSGFCCPPAEQEQKIFPNPHKANFFMTKRSGTLLHRKKQEKSHPKFSCLGKHREIKTRENTGNLACSSSTFLDTDTGYCDVCRGTFKTFLVTNFLNWHWENTGNLQIGLEWEP